MRCLLLVKSIRLIDYFVIPDRDRSKETVRRDHPKLMAERSA